VKRSRKGNIKLNRIGRGKFTKGKNLLPERTQIKVY